jgi:REP element-mobilizing transposase RayT
VHKERHPVHVTWRVVRGLPSLRSFGLARVVGQTISRINEIHDGGAGSFRIVHFSIQPNHLHLIVEGTDKASLMKGLKGLGIQMARRINEAAGTRGRVIAERYHARVLRHPRQVRNCISYVLHNHKHHKPSRHPVDPLSSGRWFTGWAEPQPPPTTDPPIVAPHTWLARSSWRTYGLISIYERPSEYEHPVE